MRYPQLERDVDMETERLEREAVGWYDDPQAHSLDDMVPLPQRLPSALVHSNQHQAARSARTGHGFRARSQAGVAPAQLRPYGLYASTHLHANMRAALISFL